MHITYHVDKHENGWAYRLDDVWSESYPTHDEAVRAAHIAAGRQQVAGRDARISYQGDDGAWHEETAKAGDRPEADVED